ncbi:MAG: acyl carrier protein [bacterium]|nr:acyl carrier protein [bacterium]
MNDDLLARLSEIVSTQLGVDPKEVVPEARILDDLGADSLDVVELVMALEETYDIIVPDEDAESLQTIADIGTYISQKTR